MSSASWTIWNQFNTDLHFASENGHLLHIVVRLIKRGATVNKHPLFGRETPLHLAPLNTVTWLSVVDRLIELGASIDVTDPYGSTPLHSACKNGQVDIIMNRYC